MAKKKAETAAKLTPAVVCTLRQMAEFGAVLPNWNPNKTKSGRYACSRWGNMKSKQYPVLGRIDGQFEDLLASGVDPEEIVQRCLDYLNTPPPRKKFAKRSAKPLYGKLLAYRSQLKRRENGTAYFDVILTTNQKRNPNFWGEG
jgi:hypothetical protein